MYKLGLSCCNKQFSDGLFEDYIKNGITEMEISLKYYEYPALDYAAVSDMAKRHGVNLYSLHLPFNFDIDISNPEYAEKTVEMHKQIIKAAAAIGIGLFVIHPSSEPIEDSDRAMRMELSKKNLALLTEYTATLGATLAVENLPRTCLGKNAEEMLELLSSDERLRACFDTNHLLGSEPVEFIKAVGKKFVTTHISDYDFKNERHWMPGEGKLDWQAVIKTLDEIGYDGAWLYEIGFTAPESITRPRDFCCADFARNAEELFCGKAPTVIGIPKPNLEAWA